jgi:hypothetical protein
MDGEEAGAARHHRWHAGLEEELKQSRDREGVEE